MALFKILKGNIANLPTNTTEGYMYITEDTGDIYVDLATSDLATESNRIHLNANQAYEIRSEDNTDFYNYDDICHIEDDFANYLPLIGGIVTGITNFTNTTASTTTTSGAVTISGGLGVAGAIHGNTVHGAVWNDYAEYRISDCQEAGRVICENGDDTLSLSFERLQPGANIISDTFGFAIGETSEAKTPVAVSGRVLAYPYENRSKFKAGDAVCAGPSGTVSIMTREEIREYPERIIGTVSAIPDYQVWGENNVIVDGRIWIKIK